MFKEFITKLDLKSIMILVLFVLCGIFFTKMMLSGESHKKERKTLLEENKKIEKQKQLLKKDFLLLQQNYEKDSLEIVQLTNQLNKINQDILKKDVELRKAKNELVNFKSSFEKTKKEIEELEKNPIKRTGSELLESIKEKTK
jgi:chromosome segregation ATPase